MERVTHEVRIGATGQAVDLDLPAEVTAVELSRLIADVLHAAHDDFGQRLEYRIRALPPGRILRSDETLAGSGLWDGRTLVLLPHVAAFFLAEELGPIALPLLTPELLVGRMATGPQVDDSALNLLPLAASSTVSRQHARLLCISSQWFVEHLSQTNPTFVNGHSVPPAVRQTLRDGDEVLFGSVCLRFRLGLAEPDLTHPRLP